MAFAMDHAGNLLTAERTSDGVTYLDRLAPDGAVHSSHPIALTRVRKLAVAADGTVHAIGSEHGESNRGTVVAVRANGEVAWTHPLADTFSCAERRAHGALAIDSRGRILVGNGEVGGGSLEALDPTGSVLWTVGSECDLEPTFGPTGVVYGAGGAFVHAIASADGRPVWRAGSRP